MIRCVSGDAVCFIDAAHIDTVKDLEKAIAETLTKGKETNLSMSMVCGRHFAIA